MDNFWVALYLTLLIVLHAIVAALPVMLLWNWLMPLIFDLPEVTFWQSLGLNLLSSILFKNNNNYKNE